ncbi:hypothetical protein WAJ58_25175, partial [Acinetobacter baumannii]
MKEEFYQGISALLEKANVNNINLNNNASTVKEAVPKEFVKSNEKVKNEVNVSKEHEEPNSTEKKDV